MHLSLPLSSLALLSSLLPLTTAAPSSAVTLFSQVTWASPQNSSFTNLQIPLNATTALTGGGISCGGSALCGFLSYLTCTYAVNKYLDATSYTGYTSYTSTGVPGLVGCAAIFECRDHKAYRAVKMAGGLSGEVLKRAFEPLMPKVPVTNVCSKCGAQEFTVGADGACRVKLDHCGLCRNVVTADGG
ncbi:MAG: hypothetical protein M1814_005040 [Vezdaea aestivalis]|nr:MAG: hypothetical protein M1814_005040 [Vezdaea aestivalis]